MEWKEQIWHLVREHVNGWYQQEEISTNCAPTQDHSSFVINILFPSSIKESEKIMDRFMVGLYLIHWVVNIHSTKSGGKRRGIWAKRKKKIVETFFCFQLAPVEVCWVLELNAML